MSPWIEKVIPCPHLDRPSVTDLRIEDRGKVWECLACGLRWEVEFVDHGHDVQNGEPGYSMRWAVAK